MKDHDQVPYAGRAVAGPEAIPAPRATTPHERAFELATSTRRITRRLERLAERLQTGEDSNTSTLAEAAPPPKDPCPPLPGTLRAIPEILENVISESMDRIDAIQVMLFGDTP